jgi:hypothetical protein
MKPKKVGPAIGAHRLQASGNDRGFFREFPRHTPQVKILLFSPRFPSTGGFFMRDNPI